MDWHLTDEQAKTLDRAFRSHLGMAIRCSAQCLSGTGMARRDPHYINTFAIDALWEAVIRWDGHRTAFTTYLRRLIRWRAATAATELKAGRIDGDWWPTHREINVFDTHDPISEVDGQDLTEALLAWVSEPYRPVIEGRLAGMTFAEIGAQLGISKGPTHERLTHSREQCREFFRRQRMEIA